MTNVRVHCTYCKKEFLKELRRFNESKKFGWRYYCSSKCQSSSTNKQRTIRCFNSSCNKKIIRTTSEIPSSGLCFCSNRCAAIVNNKKVIKRIARIKECSLCGKHYSGQSKYCSKECFIKNRTKLITKISRDNIINELQEFYRLYERVPYKKESQHYKAIRNRFGTWNKAIQAAGLDPNPIKYAKRYKAKDGHMCDSLAEKIIDDWMSKKHIIHERNIRYLNTRYTCDFKVGDYYIEFFGLKGVSDKYERSMKRKLTLIKENNIKVISIYQKDLFPISRLENILDRLINS